MFLSCFFAVPPTLASCSQLSLFNPFTNSDMSLFKYCFYFLTNLLFSILLFGGLSNKIPHNYPKDDYADKSHGESCVRVPIRR